jgi:hypothetical protein
LCVFPSFISNTNIVSINFSANLDAQNAGNGSFKFQTFSGGVVCRPHGYPPLINYLTERSLFKKCPPPHGKILKKGPEQSCICVLCNIMQSGRSGKSILCPPPPPQTRLGPYAHVQFNISMTKVTTEYVLVQSLLNASP